jgi:hypothetical protein
MVQSRPGLEQNSIPVAVDVAIKAGGKIVDYSIVAGRQSAWTLKIKDYLTQRSAVDKIVAVVHAEDIIVERQIVQ